MESQDFAQSALECGDLAPLFSINQREIAAWKNLRKLRRPSSIAVNRFHISASALPHLDLVISSSVSAVKSVVACSLPIRVHSCPFVVTPEKTGMAITEINEFLKIVPSGGL
jgi:hypothetical protein